MAEIDLQRSDLGKQVQHESSIMESIEIMSQPPSASTNQIFQDQTSNVEANWIKKIIIVFILLVMVIISIVIIFFGSEQKKPLQVHIPIIKENQSQIGKDLYFTQRIDHFNYLDKRTFQQRYFINTTFYKQNGAVIFYPCGQGGCTGDLTSFTIKLAESLNAAVINPQHRYFGVSLPFGNQSLSLQNLKYLTCEHVLADMTAIINKLPQILMKELANRTDIQSIEKPSVFLIGTSYTGSLAAWHRSKYPHLSAGAFISSAVVQTIEDYWQYDQQIGNDALMSEGCRQKLLQLTAFVESRMGKQSGKELKRIFKAEILSDIEFLIFWSSMASTFIQYSMRSGYCQELIKDGIVNMVQKFKKTQDQSYGFFQPQMFGAYYLSDHERAATTNNNTINGRSFTYLRCTQLGYFHTFSKKNGIISSQLTLSTYKNWCQSLFGSQIKLISSQPKIEYFHQTERVNIYMGGLSMKATNIILTNFIQDPWRWANIQSQPKDVDQSFYVQLVKCTDCAHCIQMQEEEGQHKLIHRLHIKILQLAKKWVLLDKEKRKG